MRKTMPSKTLLQGARYSNSANTNVKMTWMLHGWQPPNRQKQHAEMIRLNQRQPAMV